MSKVKTMNTVKTTKSNDKKDLIIENPPYMMDGEVKEVKFKKRGRPINSNSARQARLKLQAELKAQGVMIKRGRPVNKASNRQKEIERKAELRELGVLNGKKGRPINQNSKRQQRMVLRAAGKIRKPGRPKMVKQDQNDK